MRSSRTQQPGVPCRRPCTLWRRLCAPYTTGFVLSRGKVLVNISNVRTEWQLQQMNSDDCQQNAQHNFARASPLRGRLPPPTDFQNINIRANDVRRGFKLASDKQIVMKLRSKAASTKIKALYRQLHFSFHLRLFLRLAHRKIIVHGTSNGAANLRYRLQISRRVNPWEIAKDSLSVLIESIKPSSQRN